MKKSLLLLVFVCLANLLFSFSVYAQTPQPTGNTTYYYCIGDSASPLTAGGTNLLWYTTATAGPAGSATAPTPSTSAAGTTTYYVTQTVGGIESTPRRAITVNVNKQFQLFCDDTTENSVSFDFANVGQSRFDLSYTVDGLGPFISSQTAPTSFTVSGLLPGQTVVLTVTAVNAPACVANRTLSATCITDCSSFVNSNFTPIGPICAGNQSPTLPATSLEGYPGIWSPSLIDNTITRNYIFTPTNKCVRPYTMTIAVNPASPGFSDFSICSGNSVPTLDPTSPTGVTGFWSPATIDNMNSDSYTFTPDPGQCTAPQTINVKVIPSDRLTDFNWEVTTAFAENQKITVSAVALGGDYLYKLDDGPFQSSPVFEYVASGTHSITVTDQAGCSMPITKNDILVINYPKFFTPNNDGFNDYWNVTELSFQSSAYIRIFDRYGKFLKQISPNGDGWNGTYNGYFLPADDYWFVVHYIENETVKEFKSHFALKR
ncbi:T9SS type B sorting domain-containing protein [Flavobacterium sp. FZUC8N2.13]|uniref:T9SS type B sorting domain-containing protein n=1 Tax=Flavobacterium zubiriense TaxID=3138075 RepID=A0ABV4T891_9FLAO